MMYNSGVYLEGIFSPILERSGKMRQYLLDQIVEQLQKCEDLGLLDFIWKLLLESRH